MSETWILRPPLTHVLGALISVGKARLDEDFDARCCIAATRLTTRVLMELGYACKPRATWVRAGNRAFTACCVEGIEDDDKLVQRGAKFVEIDDASQTGYPAHLVTVVQGVLIDLSAGQFARPDCDIYVPPCVVIDLPPDYETMSVARLNENGSAIAYRMLGYAPPYRSAPDWKFTERTDRAAFDTLDALGVVR